MLLLDPCLKSLLWSLLSIGWAAADRCRGTPSSGFTVTATAASNSTGGTATATVRSSTTSCSPAQEGSQPAAVAASRLVAAVAARRRIAAGGAEGAAVGGAGVVGGAVAAGGAGGAEGAEGARGAEGVGGAVGAEGVGGAVGAEDAVDAGAITTEDQISALLSLRPFSGRMAPRITEHSSAYTDSPAASSCTDGTATAGAAASTYLQTHEFSRMIFSEKHSNDAFPFDDGPSPSDLDSSSSPPVAFVIEVHLFLLEQAQGLLGGLGAFLFVFEYVYRLVVIVAVGIQQEGLARVGLQIQTRIHLGTVFGCELRFYLTVLALSELDLVKQG
eukprot:CAMPEP_0170483416 /NCGR_PEP_ID=MMETSP0208-20121228/3091_1 /TAXON_ID=197538 /ORGANISM="Strombidium inclinatum, Strain S3" /LENGTH=329 /DNA_ID=CAMNT_0010756437 /DNA_START=259 /DNA_END=1250 /DNA_ORIENTATION=+